MTDIDTEKIKSLYQEWNDNKYNCQPTIKIARASSNARKTALVQMIPDLLEEIENMDAEINFLQIELKEQKIETEFARKAYYLLTEKKKC